MTPPVEPGTSWHYAAWVAFDLRLLIFAVLLAALLAAALTSLVIRSERRTDYLATWLLMFVGLFALTVFAMNLVVDQPVFVVESVFPFP